MICGQGFTDTADKIYSVTVQYPWRYIATKWNSDLSFEDLDWQFYDEYGYFGRSTIH